MITLVMSNHSGPTEVSNSLKQRKVMEVIFVDIQTLFLTILVLFLAIFTLENAQELEVNHEHSPIPKAGITR